jgi:GxxExxY protein
MNYHIEDLNETYFKEAPTDYRENDINKLTYAIIGAAMEVHNTIGKGFLEAIYMDCLYLEFEKRKIIYQREKKYDIFYKGVKIAHHYYADFLINNQLILEVKAQKMLLDENSKQIINYLAVSNCKFGLLINIGEESLKTKRFILSK